VCIVFDALQRHCLGIPEEDERMTDGTMHAGI
jgi:hypothetical protein